VAVAAVAAATAPAAATTGTAAATAEGTAPTSSRAEPSGSAERPGRVGPLALALLCILYVALAVLPAAPGSNLVLAVEHGGGSPDWLLGPLRFGGLDGADGPLAGPLFYAGLWVALALYAVVLVRVRDLGPRLVLGAIAALHVLFLLAPPLLSQDVFSYIAYARLGVEHSLDPYTHAPVDIRGDAVFPYAGSRGAESVYGPLFTLLTYPLAPLGVAGAYWVLKLVAALASLGVVALVWRAAQRLGRDPLPAVAFVGLNPLLLVHDVAGAHNETLVVLLTTAGLAAWAAGSPRAATGWSTAAAGLKASAGLVVPFLIAAARPRWLAALGAAVAVGVGIVLVALAGFGTNALDALGVLSSNQDRTSSWSFPYKTAELLGALLPGDRLDYRGVTRAAYGLAFGGVLVWLLLRTWRGASPLAAAGWATLAILVASAWLVPWYVLWLLPLAALAGDRRLVWASVALCAWMLPIAIPLD
jgi:hypothetical protein